jgi:hypothetical protein
VLVIRFTNAGAVVLDPAGSLPDGHYKYSLDGMRIMDPDGVYLDAAGDGMPGSTLTANDFRFFGDATGNGTVDAADFLLFRTDYLQTSVANSPFDYDGSGTVDAADFLQFRERYLLTTLP